MNMKAVLTDDSSVDCAGFKALDAGVVLFADERRRDALGFLPTERLRYILPAPEETTAPDGDGETAAETTVETKSGEGTEVKEETESGEGTEVKEETEASAESDTEEQADEARQLTALATDGTEISCRGFKALDSGVVLFADAERTDVAGFLPREHLEQVLAEEALATTAGRATGDERFVDAETLVGEEDAEGAETPAETGTFEQVDVDERNESTDVDEGEESAGTDESATTEAGEATVGTDESTESTEAVEVVDLAEEEELTRLAGLGETYAERLRAHGIASVSDLRTKSVEELAEAADVPTGQAERWKSQVD